MDLRKVSDKIPDEVINYVDVHAGNRSFVFVSWLQSYYNEVVERSFCARKYKGKVRITEVRRKSTGAARSIIRNLMYSYCAGYVAVFDAEDRFRRSCGYPVKTFAKEDFNVWAEEPFVTNFTTTVINPDFVKTIDEFKYSGYSGGDPIYWLKTYRKNKDIEMFGKLHIPLSPILIKNAKKDTSFRRFLYNNSASAALYGVQATMYAYRCNISIEEARRVTHDLRMAARYIPELKGVSVDRIRVVDYCDKNGIDYSLYNDYLKAIKKIGLCLKDTKNIYPSNFMERHDALALEYESLLLKEDQEKQAELYKRFKANSEKYSFIETVGEVYTVILPRSPMDLIKEGNALRHCVGKMGYDKKVADGTSVICFVRKAANPNIPYVTVELDKQLKIKQIYGERNSRPDENVITFFCGLLKERIK